VSESASDSSRKHPAARHADQLAWAVWVVDSTDTRSHSQSQSDAEMYPIVADSEHEARQQALDRHTGDGEVTHVDGPFQDAEPGVWRFEFVTEHRETVVVEAPTEEYAEEAAENERTYRGEYQQTTYEERRRLDIDP